MYGGGRMRAGTRGGEGGRRCRPRDGAAPGGQGRYGPPPGRLLPSRQCAPSSHTHAQAVRLARRRCAPLITVKKVLTHPTGGTPRHTRPTTRRLTTLADAGCEWWPGGQVDRFLMVALAICL